jgi:quinolinate synthase
MTLDLRPLEDYPAQTRERLRARYRHMEKVVPEVEWDLHGPYVAAIDELKRERNAIVLAHNYQATEIFHGVADLTGDSLALAEMAMATDAEIIVLAGVHFMAETAKILNPAKTVLIPDPEAGCSLADSITAADIRLLRERYPGAPVVTYVNTSAAVKAEADICCTSSNAVEVVESLGADRVIFLPDEFLGRWVATQTPVEIILWKGHCEVHERFTPEEIRRFRGAYHGIEVLAHPECPPDVLAEADYVGSTSGMIRHVTELQPPRVLLVTECSMAANVAVENPGVEMLRPCNICPHMNRITLPKILRSLQTMTHEVEVEAGVAARARRSVERMLMVGRGRGG